MKFLFFTKHWPERSVSEFAKMARDMSADGLDLAVRKGHAVNPDNVADALPQAARTCRDEGVSIGMVTMEWSPTDPADPATETLLAACGRAGVPLVKPGYFPYDPAKEYWSEIERLRDVLGELGALAKKHGVVVCYHTHSGPTYGSNASGLMHLLRGQDLAALGAYLDVGHLALDGEHLPMAFAMVKDYLRVVGVKSPIWVREQEDGSQVWRMSLVRLEEGLVDTRLMVEELAKTGFDGPLTFHGEHSVPRDEIVEACRDDIAFVRGLQGE